MNVGEVAAVAGVTVRTLHHYDRIALAHVDVGHLGAQHRHALPGEGVQGRDVLVGHAGILAQGRRSRLTLTRRQAVHSSPSGRRDP